VDAFQYVYYLAVAAYAHDVLRASPLELGALGTAGTVSYALACFVTGGWSDRGRALLVLRSALLLLALVALPLVLLCDSLLLLCVGHAAVGALIGPIWPPLERQLAVLSPGAILWRSLGVFNVAWTLGVGVGSLGGPLIYEAFGFKAGILAAIGIAALAFLVLCGRFPGEEGSRPLGEDVPPPELVDPSRAALFVTLGRVANFVAFLALGGLTYFFRPLTESRGIDWGLAGVLLFARDVARLAAFILLSRVRGWHYSLPWLLLGGVAGALGLAACGLAAAPAEFLLPLAVFGAFSGLSYYSSIYYGLNLRSGEGRRSGVHEGVLASGAALGPVLCGAAATVFGGGPATVPWFLGAVVAGAVGLQALLAVRARRARRARAGVARGSRLG
jgi:MFS family permease